MSPPSAPPLQLQFIVATDPNHFRNRLVIRDIRSHVMTGVQSKRRCAPQKCRSSAGQMRPIVAHPQIAPASRRNNVQNALLPHPMSLPPGVEDAYGIQFGEEPDDRIDAVERDLVMRYHPMAAMAEVKFPTQHAVDGHAWISFDYSDKGFRALHECGLLVHFIPKHSLRYIGTQHDPFSSLPQFRDPSLPLPPLLRRCISFTSPAAARWWLPTLSRDPTAFLSGFAVAIAWEDMLNGFLCDSYQNIALKSELIGMINATLCDPQKRASDFSIISIVQLMAGELMSGNGSVLTVHGHGLRDIVERRGGLCNLGGQGIVAAITTSVMYLSSISQESQPLPLYRDHIPMRLHPIAPTQFIPESPVYCPRVDFVTIAGSKHCSPATLELVRHLRHLTDLFLNQNQKAQVSTSRNSSLDDSSLPTEEFSAVHAEYGAAAAPYEKNLDDLYRRIFCLPPSNNRIYETMRLTALIYAYSLKHRICFSAAAHAAPVKAASASLKDLSIVLSLLDVMNLTNLETMWSDMVGNLFWVSMVATAASRPPSPSALSPMLQLRGVSLINPGEDQLRHERWAHKCFASHTTRLSIRMGFEWPNAVLGAQRRLLAVQELLQGPADHGPLASSLLGRGKPKV